MQKGGMRPQGRRSEEIAQSRWVEYLAQFTRENRGAHARLEVMGEGVGRQVETENQPFEGADADVKDRERTVWLHFGSGTADHLAHGIHEARAIRALAPQGGMGAVLEIEAEDGTKTLLELTPAESFALPPR